MVEVLAALLIVVLLAGCVFSIARDPDVDDEPATLEGGGSHLRD